MERNKLQLLKFIEYHFTTEELFMALCGDGVWVITEDILNRTVSKAFIEEVNNSKEMSNFITALQDL